jgi:hypothetical protein
LAIAVFLLFGFYDRSPRNPMVTKSNPTMTTVDDERVGLEVACKNFQPAHYTVAR